MEFNFENKNNPFKSSCKGSECKISSKTNFVLNIIMLIIGLIMLALSIIGYIIIGNIKCDDLSLQNSYRNMLLISIVLVIVSAYGRMPQSVHMIMLGIGLFLIYNSVVQFEDLKTCEESTVLKSIVVAELVSGISITLAMISMMSC